MNNSSKKSSEKPSKIEREVYGKLQKMFPDIKFFFSREEMNKYFKEQNRLTSK